jgi:TonB dependent receptor
LTLCAFPNAANTACGATPLQNFIAGIVTTASIQVGAVSRQFSYHGIAGFIQDDWRIFPRLTVNLGLRYENTSTIHEVNGLIGNVAFGTPTGVTQQGQGGPLYKLDPWGFAPRFGLAWDISGKGTTVLRTGFNIAYQNPTIQAFITPGMTLIPTGIKLSNGTTSITEGGTINTQNLSAFAPSSKTAATIVAGQQFFGGNVTNLVGTCSPTVPCAIGGAASHLDMPMIMNWSFGVQHAITNNLTVDVNYVGTHGQHLFDFSDINQPAPGANTNPTVENGRRPLTQYPWLSQIKVLGAITNVSNYNGLQIIATQRFHHGLSFIATYAYAHALDSGSSDLTPLVPENSLAPQNEYGNSTYDLRHRFTFGPSYEIPGKKGFAQMLQGWQVASTVKLFSGFPINAIDPTTPLGGDDISGIGEGQDRWDLVGNPHDFNGFGNAAPIPCFYNPAGNPGAPNTSAFSKSGCTAGLPAACSNGAASEPNSPVGTGITAPGNTAIFELNKLGCYMKGDSVIIPPAPGTFGTMSRDEIYSIGTWEWDGSIVKAFKFGERITAQFRADLYNVTNTTFFAAASATLSSPSTFGASGSTPDVNSPFVGTGGPRKIQLGLKLLF